MKQVVTHVFCDRADVHLDGPEPGTEIRVLNTKGKPVALDMCEPCQKGITYLEVLDLADAIGQPTELPKTTRNRTPKPSPGPCQEPGCGADFPTWQGLSIHTRRTHDKALEIPA